MFGFLLVLTLLLACGFCAWVYYRREFVVRTRSLLLAARLIAVAGVVALLWNPMVSTGPSRDAPDRYVVLDGSASMAAVSADGASLWETALRRATALAGDDARLLVAGTSLRTVDPDSVEGLAPSGVESLLAEAVVVAAEAGGREVILVTDRRLHDPIATAMAARRLGVSLAVDTLPNAGGNLGLGRLALPSSATGGDRIVGRVEVEGTTLADSVTVAISVDGELREHLRVAAPASGGSSGVDFALGTGPAPGAHTVTARIEHSDAFSLDDERNAVVHVDPEETGVLLVSFAPDWEPRFLLPVLDQITGLPVRGFLKTGPDRFHPMDAGAVGGAAAIDQVAMERLLRRAEMVVAMGVDASAAEFLEAATARTRRLLLFPRDGIGAAAGGVAAGGALPGEWYLDEAPPSPIAGEVERFVGAGLPPLGAVLPMTGTGAGDGTALHVRLGGAGQPQAALVLRRDGRRRIGVVLARGFWRWAFRDGAPREHYRRLWAAVGGWMMADEPVAAGPGVRPVRPVLPRGIPLSWLARGYEAEAIALTVRDSVGARVLDSTLTVPPGGSFATPALPAGSYGYAATTGDPDAAGDTVAGTFHVESFTDEMLHLPTDAADLTVRAPPGDPQGERSRPLRAWPFPYLLILAAVCVEWIGRRRAGLR